MSPKTFLPDHFLFLKKLSLLVFLFSFKMAAQTAIFPVTRIYTDWNGYWTSNGATGVGNRPDRENNLLAFTWNNVTYSTGVNNTVLDAHAIGYSAQKFRALKIQTLGQNNSTYILQGSMIDESASTASIRPVLAGTLPTGAELASRLTDGINGLALGTGVANIKAGTAEFKIGTNNLNLLGIGDGFPDLIVTQVADPGGALDTFKFVDAAGNTVGTEVSINFTSVAAVGTYSLDLFKTDGGANPFSPASTRDIRILGIELSEFNLTSANSSQVDRFVINFSGSSDCAFIAFNTKSLKIAELKLVKKATLSNCGKQGDVINYAFEITNTGEVPITDIHVTDPLPGLVITGNSIASLAPGASTTLNGTYTITATDVDAGKVINTAKVTGTDPSLNTVEDISGTTTVLLTTPAIGTITDISCVNALGSVVLNDLPATGTWTLQRSPDNVTLTGSGATATITNIPVGTYTFRVTNSTGCKSPPTATVEIKNQASTTWNGSAWSNGIPTATKSVIFTGAYTLTADLDACSCTVNSTGSINVPSGRTLNIVNAVTVLSGGSLTFENSSSLLQTNSASNINSGNITYKRNSVDIRQADYVYWSTPVKGQTLGGVSPLTLSDKYLSWEATKWVANPSTSIMAAGKGYIIRGPETFSNTVRTPYTASFSGVPNNGDITGETAIPSTYYLIGNPYPSALYADDFINANKLFLVGTMYFWTHNTPVVLGPNYKYNSDDYATYNLSGGAGTQKAPSGGAAGTNINVPSGYIAAGQAFFMGSKAAGNISFTNSMRRGGNNNGQFFKSGSESKTADLEKNRVWLDMTNEEGAFKQILVGYIEGATNDYEDMYDGLTFNGNKYVDFYSINNTSKLTIQGRALPFADTDTVPLGYRTTVDGSFTISLSDADGKLSTQAVYLEDKNNGTVNNLRAGNYTFATAAGTFADRFVLRYTNKTLGTGDFENTENGILVSVKDKTIKVVSSKETIKEVTVFDISGKLLLDKKKLDTADFQISNLQSSNQVLLVKVTLNNNYTTTKKIVF